MVKASQGYGFSSGYVWMWELDCEESWAPKNWCFWAVVLKKTLESPLDHKEIQPVHSKGDQSWVFIGRTDAEAETPMLWSPHAKSWLTGKHPDAGRDWGQEEKGMAEDEMAGWHHWLDGREFEWTLGVDDGQGGLACCDSWGHKESDTTERLIWSESRYQKTKHEVLTDVAFIDKKKTWVTSPVTLREGGNTTLLLFLCRTGIFHKNCFLEEAAPLLDVKYIYKYIYI